MASEYFVVSYPVTYYAVALSGTRGLADGKDIREGHLQRSFNEQSIKTKQKTTKSKERKTEKKNIYQKGKKRYRMHRRTGNPQNKTDAWRDR